MAKKAYIGVTEAKNLVTGGSFEADGVWSCWSADALTTEQALFGTRSLKLTGDQLADISVETPIVGHKYYAREYIKTVGEVTIGDGRFEVHAGDGEGLNWVYGWNRGNYPEWTIISDVQTVGVVNGSSYVLRTFKVGGSGTAYIDGVMLIDLTATYGAGNEPDKAWCDANIPFFEGTHCVPNPFTNGKARKVKTGYVGVETEIPIYEESVATVEIDGDNITDMFDVANGEYYFEPTSGKNASFYSNNKYEASTTASTVLKAKYNMSVSFGYTYSSEQSYDTFTLKVAGTTVENAVSGSTQSKTYSGSLTAGQTIEFTYSKDGSQDKNNDECSFRNMTVTATVKTQVGAETKSVARLIKKAYIGIGGVARPCFGAGELAYYGTITGLTNVTQQLAAASVGDYALFGGGITDKGSARNSVTAYTSSLVRSSPAALGEARYDLAATSVGDFALFGGGSPGSGESKVVDAYSSSLTRTQHALTYSIKRLAATHVGNYALFGGGYLSTAENNIVYAFDTSLTMTVLSSSENVLSARRDCLAAAAIGNYALFAGGAVDDILEPGSKCVDVYDASLTHSIAPDLSVGRYYLSGTAVGNYVLFCGGWDGRDVYDNADAYDKSLTKTGVSGLSKARLSLSATTVEDFAIFAGGETANSSSAGTAVVDVYDASLTRTAGTSLNKARIEMGATTIGNYALFGGGDVGGGYGTNIVDAFVVA